MREKKSSSDDLLQNATKEKKIYVLDTNVLISDPDALYKFQDNVIVIPDVVIEELDNHKKDPGDRGYNVRQVHRNLEELRQKGKLSIGVKTSENGYVIVVPSYAEGPYPVGWFADKADNMIVMTAKRIQSHTYDPDRVILVTNDVNVHIKADAVDVRSEVYKNERIEEDYLHYDGRETILVPDQVFETFHQKGIISCDIVSKLAKEQGLDLLENMFLIVTKETTGGTLLGRVKNRQIECLKYENSDPFGITPRNAAQRFCIEALMTPAEEVPLVIITGPAGTAKTFLTLACGLEQTVEQKNYRRITITRSNCEFDKSIGALPGDEDEKIGPLVRGCMDNLELLVDEKGVKNTKNQDDRVSEKVNYLFDIGAIRAEALSFLRGRSITQQILFVDEAQNTTPSQMKGILSRAGSGSKIVICGDLDQIDNPRLDRHNNGLAYAIKVMMGDPLCCIIGQREQESTRSALARRVIERDRELSL